VNYGWKFGRKENVWWKQNNAALPLFCDYAILFNLFDANLMLNGFYMVIELGKKMLHDEWINVECKNAHYAYLVNEYV
jgi:hypothetical protein